MSGDAQGYLEPFTLRSAGEVVRDEGEWLSVTLVSARPSAWTGGRTPLHFSPSTGLLQRGPDLIRLPDAVAADLAAARPLGDRPAGAARAGPGQPVRSMIQRPEFMSLA